MISKIQSNNNTVNFRALKPIELGKTAQNILSGANNLSSVHQRIAIGTSAFLLQPLIDLRNKEVDKDTREVSAVRSAAKAVVGTATGIIIRDLCMKFAEFKYAKKDAMGNIMREAGEIIIDPEKVKQSFGKGFDALNLNPKELADAVKRVPAVVGTLAALLIMVVTNFVVDAPLTNKLSESLEKIALKFKNGGSNNG